MRWGAMKGWIGRRDTSAPSVSCVVLAFILVANVDGSNGTHAGESNSPNSQGTNGVVSDLADTKAAACARTLDQFIPELDAVMAENPRSINRYNAVLARYLFLRNGVPGLPPPVAGASVEGCKINQVVEIS